MALDRAEELKQLLRGPRPNWLGTDEAPMGIICPLCGAVVASQTKPSHVLYHEAEYLPWMT